MPTPYRTSFYNELHKAGLNFEVYYLRNIEADRNWDIDLSDLKHPFYIDRGIYRMIGRYHVHFNIKIILKLLKEKDSEFVLSLSWNDLDMLVLVVLKRLGILKNKIHFWSEANYLTLGARRDNFLKKYLRRYVYDSSNGAQLSSGKMTEITLDMWGARKKAYIPLPNTIEEEKFKINEFDIAKRKKNNIVIFFMPVRLVENVKGIINFFKSIGVENIRKGLFLIAGEGRDKSVIQSFIRELKVEEHISLLGHSTADKVAECYRKANVFVLPSFSDASPLTVMEAMSMRLPLLISERCGNHFETVVNGRNGYIFNPSDPGSVKTAFESLMLRTNDFTAMGEISGSIYDRCFERKVVINKFIGCLTNFSDANN